MSCSSFANDLKRCSTVGEKTKLLHNFFALNLSVEEVQTLSSLVSELVSSVAVSSDIYGQARKNDEEFAQLCHYVRLVCNALSKIAHALNQYELETKKKWLVGCLPVFVTLCALLQHEINTGTQFDKETEKCANKTMTQFLILGGYNNVQAALEDQDTYIFKKILDKILPSLASEKWKDSCAASSTFIYILWAVKGDILIKNFDALLPFTLILIDDFVERNVMTGIKCMNHLLDQVPPSEIKLRGRSEVVHDALQRKLYTKDAGIASVLIPCILRSLQHLESDMMRKRGCSIPKHDECFETILNNFHLSSNASVRRIYADALPRFITIMGIQSIGHMKMLLIVIEYGMESTDLNILKSCVAIITALIHAAWPRISSQSEKLLEFLVKALYRLENNSGVVKNQPAISSTTDYIVGAMTLLALVSKDLVMEITDIMTTETDLNLKKHANKLRQLIDSTG